MSNFALTLAQAAPLFLLIFVGYGLMRVMKWPASMSANLTQFLFTAALPAMLFRMMSKLSQLPPVDARLLIAFFGSCFVVFVLARIIGWKVFSLDEVGQSIFGLGGVFSNNVLQRIRQLAVQSANGTNSASDRQALQSEVNQLVAELDRSANTTAFNGIKLLDGSYRAQTFQIGSEANQSMNVTIGAATSDALGVKKVSSNNPTGIEAAAARDYFATSGITGSVSAAAANLSARNAVGTQTPNNIVTGKQIGRAHV